MMLCAFKADTFEFVRFDGLDSAIYPDWFNELVKEQIITYEFGCYLYTDERHGDLAIALGDVFIINKRGDIMYVPCWQFTDEWFEVN